MDFTVYSPNPVCCAVLSKGQGSNACPKFRSWPDVGSDIDLASAAAATAAVPALVAASLIIHKHVPSLAPRSRL